MLYDAFICHATEDKQTLVRPLAEMLSEHHLHIWYDEFSLTVGDSLRQTIDEGLAKSRFGIVILSPSFFRKGWAQRELDGLVARQISEDRRLILPIWHEITREEIVRISPPLADIVAINSNRGLFEVCKALVRKLRPDESPLIAARDELIRWGIEPPVISDEWWLDIVEASNRIAGYGAYVPEWSVWGTWTFPLPHEGDVGAQRGVHLAWTAMQLDWSAYAEENKICQITHPEIVHKFIENFPGLRDLCHQFPDYLACYAPQLTLPEFSGSFSADFDKMLLDSEEEQRKVRNRGSQSGIALTVDERVPLCATEIALRHSTFGNYRPASVANFYVQGEMFGPTSKCFEHFDYVIWFLSHDSSWLPDKSREFIIEGVREWAVWFSLHQQFDRKNAFVDTLITARSATTFRFTKRITSWPGRNHCRIT